MTSGCVMMARAMETRRDLFLGDAAFLDQAEGHVVTHGHRVEQRALLEDHADLAAQVEQVLFLHLRDVVPQHRDAPAVGADQPESELEDGGLARAGDAEDGLGLAALELERDAVEHDDVVEPERDILEHDGDVVGVMRGRVLRDGCGERHEVPIRRRA